MDHVFACWNVPYCHEVHLLNVPLKANVPRRFPAAGLVSLAFAIPLDLVTGARFPSRERWPIRVGIRHSR